MAYLRFIQPSERTGPFCIHFNPSSALSLFNSNRPQQYSYDSICHASMQHEISKPLLSRCVSPEHRERSGIPDAGDHHRYHHQGKSEHMLEILDNFTDMQ